MAKFEAIIFDCDGVLVDSEAVGLAETTAYLQSKGFSWTAADIVREFTGMHMASLQLKFADAYAQILGRTPSEQELDELYHGFVDERRKQRHKMALVPGAFDDGHASHRIAVRGRGCVIVPKLIFSPTKCNVISCRICSRRIFIPQIWFLLESPHLIYLCIRQTKLASRQKSAW